MFLFGLANLTKLSVGSAGTNLSTTLYNRIRRRLSRLSSSVSSSRSSLILVMAPVSLLLQSFLTNLIALFCIRSSLPMSPLRYGFQMVAPYSMIDLTRVTYVVFRHVSGTFLKFLLRKPSVAFAFLHTLLMWMLHFRSFEIWSPKYGLSCISCSVCFSSW